MFCAHIPTISYTQWNRKLFQEAESSRIPLEGSLELTYHCNFKCQHCYIVDYPIKKELSTLEFCQIIDQISQAGCLFLLLSGGEPLMRKDFAGIYLYAIKKGLLVTVFTNGALITPEIADLWAGNSPFSIEITLYGATETTYEKVTGTSQALQRCLNGIKLLQEREIPLRLKYTVSTLNKHELFQTQKLAEKLGLEFRFDPELNPRLDHSKDNCKIRLSPQEIVDLDIADERRAKDWRGVCENFWGTVISDARYLCAAGSTHFLIDPQGAVKLCTLLPILAYIKPQESKHFTYIWNEIIPWFLQEKRRPDSRCNTCPIFSICNRCAGLSLLETSDFDAPVPFCCAVARLRASVFTNPRIKEKIFLKGGFSDAVKEELPQTGHP